MTQIAVIPFYYIYDEERAEITRKIFHHYRNVQEKRGDILFLGIGSEGSLSRSIWEEHFNGEWYLEYDQGKWEEQPTASGSEGLRDKYNVSIQFARKLLDDPRSGEIERVWMLGSDDLLTSNFFNDSPKDLVGVGPGIGGGCLWWRYPTDDYYWWDGHFPHMNRDALHFCGGNIGMSRKFLDYMKWKPYQFENDEQGTERFAASRGMTFEARLQVPHKFLWWLVKGKTCLNPWDLEIRGKRVFDNWPFAPAPVEEVTLFRKYWDTL